MLSFSADISRENALDDYLDGIDIVFHCAALKHVEICERAPEQARRTNVEGVTFILESIKRSAVQKLVFTSSDKAVNPTNVMGTTKLLGERLLSAASRNSQDVNKVFTTTRFGNVLGSNGSVYTVFKRQIIAGLPITLTAVEMTRFVMSKFEAARLVISTVKCGRRRGVCYENASDQYPQ